MDFANCLYFLDSVNFCIKIAESEGFNFDSAFANINATNCDFYTLILRINSFLPYPRLKTPFQSPVSHSIVGRTAYCSLMIV